MASKAVNSPTDARTLYRHRLEQPAEGPKSDFFLYVQPSYVPGFATPERITIYGRVQEGPKDDRFYVVDAKNKKPYGPANPSYPPYQGPHYPPVKPGTDGNFVDLEVSSREFSAASMYATVRRVWDIMESYYGKTIEFAWNKTEGAGSAKRPLELIPLIEWNNAQSGWGFLEFGYPRGPTETFDLNNPYSRNFDVLAHEVGHNIVFSIVGFPTDEPATYFWGFHESAGDLVAILSSLHFNRMVDTLLKETYGNLYSINPLSRLGEISPLDQIRVALNYKKIYDVGTEEHELSLPITGAFFDIFVEVFFSKLVEKRYITEDLAYRAIKEQPGLEPEFQEAFKANPEGFKHQLLEARDYLGLLLTNTWKKLQPTNFTFGHYLVKLLEADKEVSNSKYREIIADSFLWRGVQLPDVRFRVHRVSEWVGKGGHVFHPPPSAPFPNYPPSATNFFPSPPPSASYFYPSYPPPPANFFPNYPPSGTYFYPSYPPSPANF